MFIDSIHTYPHVTYELEKFSPKLRHVIALHNTSGPWGDKNDTAYKGDFSEYPISIDRAKKGVWTAVQDFLARHPEWKLRKRELNQHGLTVLEREEF